MGTMEPMSAQRKLNNQRRSNTTRAPDIIDVPVLKPVALLLQVDLVLPVLIFEIIEILPRSLSVRSRQMHASPKKLTTPSYHTGRTANMGRGCEGVERRPRSQRPPGRWGPAQHIGDQDRDTMSKHAPVPSWLEGQYQSPIGGISDQDRDTMSKHAKVPSWLEGQHRNPPRAPPSPWDHERCEFGSRPQPHFDKIDQRPLSPFSAGGEARRPNATCG